MHYNLKEIQNKIIEEWEKSKIYSFHQTKAPAGKVFSIDTPPPTISGEIHMGHVYSYVQQDFAARFKRMQGFKVFYPFGFDDNGIATERFVEKEKGIKANKMSREEFNKLCLQTTKEVEERMKNLWRELGISADWSLLYRTISPEVIKISQLSFIKLYKAGRIYKKNCPNFWCPECSTAISQAELKDVEMEGELIDIAFKTEKNEEIIISTTRPELLPACVAVFYNPEDKRYKKLRNKEAIVPIYSQKVPILEDNRAQIEKGTGLVMCCTFGDQTDIDWYLAHNLPLRVAINEKGEMTELTRELKGMKVGEARKTIIRKLEEINALRGRKRIKHFVKVHERCSTPIEFLVTEQWFIKQLDLKDMLLDAGRKMNWFPEHMIVRYNNWVKGLEWDWCISRQRYFGVPFPVWYCKKCKQVILAEEKDLPVNPLRDRPRKKCECSSQDFSPEKDVMDTWATSSLTPLINAKWDGENYDKEIYPMDLRPQGHEIISFWLFHTLLKCLLHTGKIPFRDVYLNGWVCDEKGEKMSKSKGNIISPTEILKQHNSDAIRYWGAGTKYGEDIYFSKKDILEGEKLIKKMLSVLDFSKMFIENFENPRIDFNKLESIDKWILSKASSLSEKCCDYYNSYEFFNVRREVRTFFLHDFCDNYLEIVKKRLYKGDENAKKVLYHVLLVFIRIMAPIMPFITEFIYQQIFRKSEGFQSVHIMPFPKKEFYESSIESAGDLAISIISALRKYKTSKNLPLNSKIKKATIYADLSLKNFSDAISDVMNIENLEFKPTGEIKEKIVRVKLNYSSIGKKYKDSVPELEKAIKESCFEIKGNNLLINCNGKKFELKEGEFHLEKEFYIEEKKGEIIRGPEFVIKVESE